MSVCMAYGQFVETSVSRKSGGGSCGSIRAAKAAQDAKRRTDVSDVVRCTAIG